MSTRAPSSSALEQQILTHAEELDEFDAGGEARFMSSAGEATTPPPDPVFDSERRVRGRCSRPGYSRRVAVPPVGRHHVVRARLDSMLEGALDVVLVVVAAPAGAGKTAALSGWLNRRAGGGSWVTLDASHNDPAVFWSTIAAALHLPRPDVHRDARSMVRSLRERTESVDVDVLVLDDYHIVTNPTIHAEMDALLATVPTVVHVVIGTRHDPPLRLAGLRAQGQLQEIRYDDLRLDLTEVDHLLNDVLGSGNAAGRCPHAGRSYRRMGGRGAAGGRVAAASHRPSGVRR